MLSQLTMENVDLVTLFGIGLGFILIFAGTYIAIDGYQKLRAIKTRNKKLDQLIMLSELEEE